MAAQLEQLAQYWQAKGNKLRADRYTTLAAEERAIGGPETIVPVEPSTVPVPAGSFEALPFRLKLIPFEIEIPTVSEEVYTETRKAVEATGMFIAPIRPIPIEDLLTEDRDRRQRRFNHDWVNSSSIMRATVPPQMEAFIDPKAVRIEGSNGLSIDEHKQRIAEAEASFRERLPETVRPFIGLHMVDPSTLSQLEDRYMDEHNGALLLPDFFARTDVKTVEGYVAYVGRSFPANRREVHGWSRDYGFNDVFAVAVGVLPRESTA